MKFCFYFENPLSVSTNSIPLFAFTTLYTFVRKTWLFDAGDGYGFSYLKGKAGDYWECKCVFRSSKGTLAALSL